MEAMDNYDEDLYENIFLQTLQKKFTRLFDEATSMRWMVLVPRCGALENMTFNVSDFENHILLPMDDRPTIFYTVNHKETLIRDGTITTGEGFPRKKRVSILFEEIFFNKNNESYRVLCVSRPLEGGLDTGDEDCENLSRKRLVGFYGYDDCCQLLWGSTGNLRTKFLLQNAVDSFMKTQSRGTNISMKNLVESVVALFKKSVSIVYRDSILKKNALSNLESKTNINIAVETYLMYHTYHLVFRHICTCMADRDSVLNKITRSLSALQLVQLNVRPEFCCNVPRAGAELTNLTRLTSPMNKLNCLKRVMTLLVSEPEVNHKTHYLGNGEHVGDEVDDASHKSNADLHPFGSDDLLPILVFLIVKADIPNWWSQWTLMKNFCLAMPVLTSELEFYLSTLEAGLEYVTSGQLRELKSQIDATDLLLSPVLVSSPGSSSAEDDDTKSMTELIKMVCLNNIEAVKKLLLPPDPVVNEKPESVNHIDLLCHPLCSCPKCQQMMVSEEEEARIKRGVTINSKNEKGLSALHVAAMFGHAEMADLLIEKGTDVNAVDFLGRTPLHVAAQRGHQRLTMLLLHHNAAINIQDRRKNTALHWAAINGHIDCVKALIYMDQINRLLDINARNETMETALHLAAKWGYENIVNMLLEHGASPFILNRKNQTACDVAHNSRIYKMLNEVTALQMECSDQAKLSRSVSFFFKRNSDVTVDRRSSVDIPQKNCDHSAAVVVTGVETESSVGIYRKVKPRPSSSLQTKIEKLLRSVADGDVQMVNHHLNWTEYEIDHPEVRDLDITKITLCHPLCQCDKCKHIQRLTTPASSGLHVNIYDAQGYTPLHVAALHGHADLVQLFLRRGANINAVTKNHLNTPLHFACNQPNVKILKQLVHDGDKLTSRDDQGNSPLHYSCLSQNTTHVWLLLQLGADVNAANLKGNTPLHDAVKLGHPIIVLVLVLLGADVRRCNDEAQTPLDFVRKQEIDDCIKIATIQRSGLHSHSFSLKNSLVAASASNVTPSDTFSLVVSHFDEAPGRVNRQRDDKAVKQIEFRSTPDLHGTSFQQQDVKERSVKDDSFCTTYFEAQRKVCWHDL